MVNSLQFPNSIHLLCFLQVKDRIAIKLKEIGIATDDKAFMREILGYQEGTHFFTGLVDCDSEEEFDQKFAALEVVWNEREMSACETVNPVFFTGLQAIKLAV